MSAAVAGTRDRMSIGTTLLLARAGTRTDTVRIVLTVLGSAAATLGLLAVGTVLSIPAIPNPNDSTFSTAPYTSELLAEVGLRRGLSVGLLLVTLPVLLFVVQCARLGAPARERRLAALRLAGATPSDVVRVVAVESGLAACLGATLGTLGYFVGRVLADAPDATGYRPLPTDVLPPVWLIVPLVLAVPVLVVALSVLLLRRVAAAPFGLARNARAGRPPVWPVVLLLAGVVVLASTSLVQDWGTNLIEYWEVPYLPGYTGAPTVASMMVGGALVLAGLVFGAARLSRATGTVLRRYARRPVVLLAAGRAVNDPWLGGRSLSVLFAATLLGAGAASFRQVLLDNGRATAAIGAAARAYTGVPVRDRVDPFYDHAFRIVDLGVRVVLITAAAALLIALVERIVGQRRTLAGAVAAGVPRRTLAGAVLLHTAIATLPGIVLAALIGALGGWATRPSYTVDQPALTYCVVDHVAEACHPTDPAQRHISVPDLHAHVTTLIPWGQVGWTVLVALVAVLVTTALSLPFLRAGTRVEELRTE